MFSSDVFCLESLETLFSGVGAGRDAAERPSTQPKLGVTTSFEDRNNPEVKDGGSFLQSQLLGGGGRKTAAIPRPSWATVNSKPLWTRVRHMGGPERQNLMSETESQALTVNSVCAGVNTCNPGLSSNGAYCFYRGPSSQL